MVFVVLTLQSFHHFKSSLLRVHVERVIGNVRQKYSMLQSTLPIDYMYVIKRNGEECPIIDRIVRVCCASCNVCNSVVPLDLKKFTASCKLTHDGDDS